MQMSASAVAARRLLTAASASGGESAARTWKILSFVVALPGVAVCIANAVLKSQHEEHDNTFVAYSHLRIRTKKFPWGDGNHSLFHNPHTNALPDGFEEHDH
uniref:Cytochrome c oxidase subunit n=1 Tax=Neogobius melanostomus TaxID=47308 RepID=A0A8C6T0H6_9GOBI